MVEADFQREYNINLSKEVHTMTWRRFQALLSGLSRDSVFIFTHNGRKDGTIPIDDDETAEKIFDKF